MPTLPKTTLPHLDQFSLGERWRVFTPRRFFRRDASQITQIGSSAWWFCGFEIGILLVVTVMSAFIQHSASVAVTAGARISVIVLCLILASLCIAALRARRSTHQNIVTICRLLVGMAFLCAISVVLNRPALKDFQFAFPIYGTILLGLLVRGRRSLFGKVFTKPKKEVIIVGSGPRATALYNEVLQFHSDQYEVIGFVDSPLHVTASDAVRERLLGSLDSLDKMLMKLAVDQVMIALPIKSRYDEIQRAIAACERIGVEAEYLPDIFNLSRARPRIGVRNDRPVVQLKVVQEDYRLVLKRIIDVLGAICILLVLSPVMFAIAISVKLSSPGPVLFAQERFGLNRRRFKMYKFRTMVADAEKIQERLEHQNEKTGPIFKIRKDPRITSFGKILRVTSMDELPQLWNVIRGEMSLVGPRPMSVRDVLRFEEDWIMRRFSVRPGLTCLWQISGRSNTTFDYWIALDLKYIDTWSLTLDFRILGRTIPAVFTGNGAA